MVGAPRTRAGGSLMSETFRFSPGERAQLARLIVDSGAFQTGDFTLASGKKSPFYIDAKRAIVRTAPESAGPGVVHRADRSACVTPSAKRETIASRV